MLLLLLFPLLLFPLSLALLLLLSRRRSDNDDDDDDDAWPSLRRTLQVVLLLQVLLCAGQTLGKTVFADWFAYPTRPNFPGALLAQQAQQTWRQQVGEGHPLRLVASDLDAFAFGARTAASLGVPVAAVRTVALVATAAVTAVVVSSVGAIGFVGLIVPHLARMICGPDYRWILAYSLLLTPIVLLVADIVGRVIVSPGELQVGVVLGVIGAPAFILLVRYRNLAEL